METPPPNPQRAGLPWPMIIGIVGVLVALGVWRWVQSGKPKPIAAGPPPATAEVVRKVEATQTSDADGAVNAIVLSRDGHWEAWGTSAGVTAKRTDGSGRAMSFAPIGASHQVPALCFADDQTILAIFGDAIYACSVSTGASVVAKRFTGAKPLCVATTIRGEHVILATGFADGTVEIEPMLVQGGLVLSAGDPKKAQEHKGAVRAIAISPDGRHIASTGDDALLRVIAASDAGYVTSQLIEPGGDSVGAGQCVAFSADGQFVAAGSRRGAAVWATGNWSARHRLAKHDKSVTRVAFADANTLVTGAADGMIFWRISSGEVIGRIDEAHGGIGGIAFTGDALISGGKDQKVRRWNWKRIIASE